MKSHKGSSIITRKKPKDIVIEALAYLKAGFSIIPIGSNKKALVLWKKYQTHKPSRKKVKGWWKKYPSAQIGLITGQNNNLSVVDCDSEGSLNKIRNILPPGYKCPCSTSQSGEGTHLFFGYTPGLKTKSGVDRSLDVRNDGGYIIVPPSKGTNGPYIWNDGSDIRNNSVLPSMPPALFTYLKDRMNGKAKLTGSGKSFSFDGICDDPQALINKGTRDDKLFHLALTLFKAGESYDLVRQYVLTGAKGCLPPFSEKEAQVKVDSAYKRFQNGKAGNTYRKELFEGGEQLSSRVASSIQEKKITWLWPGVIPAEMSESLTGLPAMGKTLVAIDAAARISSGAEFPVYAGRSRIVRGRVLYVSSENVPEKILVPRLVAARADTNKVKIIEGTFIREGEILLLDITKHLPLLEREAREFGEVKLIVFDPIASFLPERINTNQQNQVRRAMDRISNFSYKLGITSVVVMHWPKDKSQSLVNRAAGSGQFMAAMKMSWSIVQDEKGPRNARLLVPQKTNITGGSKSLKFTIHGYKYVQPITGETIRTARIKYGELIDDDPESLISPRPEIDNKVAQACAFLKRKIKGATVLYASPLIAEAVKNGIPDWALYKAKKRMGVEDDKEGKFQGRTYWFKRGQ